MAFCVSCGNDNGENRFCTRCGTDRTAPFASAPLPAGERASSLAPLRVWLSVLGLVVVACGLTVVAVVSRYDLWERDRRGMGVTHDDIAAVENSEARPTLRRIQELQHEHRKRHGTFTRNLGDPSAPDALAGYAAPDEEGFFRFRVSEAGRRELCIEAELTERGRRGGLSVSSMDEKGRHYLGPGCRGAVLMHHTGDGFEAQAEEEPGG